MAGPPRRATRKVRCGQKKRRTKQRARKDRRSRIARGAAPESIGVYECKWCREHHVGHRQQTANDFRFNGKKNRRRSRGRRR